MEVHKHRETWCPKRKGLKASEPPCTCLPRSLRTLFVPLFAVVHAAEYAPISWHTVQGAFIPKGATAEHCKMVICPLEKDHGKTKNQTQLKQMCLRSLGIWMSGWTTKGGSDSCATKMSAERRKGGRDITSALRLHDATNADLSKKHEMAKQAANEMALKRSGQGVFRSAHFLGSGDLC